MHPVAPLGQKATNEHVANALGACSQAVKSLIIPDLVDKSTTWWHGTQVDDGVPLRNAVHLAANEHEEADGPH